LSQFVTDRSPSSSLKINGKNHIAAHQPIERMSVASAENRGFGKFGPPGCEEFSSILSSNANLEPLAKLFLEQVLADTNGRTCALGLEGMNES
jgi:hypothetical protein